MRTLPCDTFDRNALWLQLVLLAQGLMTFTQLLTLEPGELGSAEPQQLRYKLRRVAGGSRTPRLS